MFKQYIFHLLFILFCVIRLCKISTMRFWSKGLASGTREKIIIRFCWSFAPAAVLVHVVNRLDMHNLKCLASG